MSLPPELGRYEILPYINILDLYQNRHISPEWYRRYLSLVPTVNNDPNLYRYAISNNELPLLRDLLRSGGLRRLRIREIGELQQQALNGNLEALRIFFRERERLYGAYIWIDSDLGLQAAARDPEIFEIVFQSGTEPASRIGALFLESPSDAIILLQRYLQRGVVDANFISDLFLWSHGTVFRILDEQGRDDLLQALSDIVSDSNLPTGNPRLGLELGLLTNNWDIVVQALHGPYQGDLRRIVIRNLLRFPEDLLPLADRYIFEGTNSGLAILLKGILKDNLELFSFVLQRLSQDQQRYFEVVTDLLESIIANRQRAQQIADIARNYIDPENIQQYDDIVAEIIRRSLPENDPRTAFRLRMQQAARGRR